VKDGGAGPSRSESVRVPVETTPDPSAGTSSNPKDTPRPAAQQAQVAPPSTQQPPQKPQQTNPAGAEAARLDTTAAAAIETPQPVRPTAEPPKPFSLAARIRQPEPGDLPEAPKVDATAPSVTIRPTVPGRLPAPPAPALPPPQVQSQPPASAPPAHTAAPSNVKVGGKVQEPRLLRRVDAVYPPMARQARVGGVVRIQAMIGKDGKVKKIEVLSGPPLLRQAAIDSVQKWVYSPSLLNGAPVEASTDVEVNFNLSAR
jgi:TonB family protein